MTTNSVPAAETEKRTNERYDCEATIKWSYFNTNRFFDAKLLNFSKNGIYFETFDPIKPKTTLFIRVKSFLPKDAKCSGHECLSSVFLGEVKWCRPLSEGEIDCYGVGVRHCKVKE